MTRQAFDSFGYYPGSVLFMSVDQNRISCSFFLKVFIALCQVSMFESLTEIVAYSLSYLIH